MTAYRVFIEKRVFDALSDLKRREQQRLVRQFDRLASDPFQLGDYAEQDELGRPIQVLIVGRHALFFWADHPVKEVKILDLRVAGN